MCVCGSPSLSFSSPVGVNEVIIPLYFEVFVKDNPQNMWIHGPFKYFGVLWGSPQLEYSLFEIPTGQNEPQENIVLRKQKSEKRFHFRTFKWYANLFFELRCTVLNSQRLSLNSQQCASPWILMTPLTGVVLRDGTNTHGRLGVLHWDEQTELATNLQMT